MAKDSTSSAASLQPDDSAIVPRIRLSEVGFTGLRVNNKTILEEAQRIFRYPDMLKVVSEMRINPTVAAALNAYKMLIGRVKWDIKPPTGATQEQIDRAKFVEQCFADMECSWGSFISETLTYLEYGFCIQEKVFRRRLRTNGSRYNDGLVGIRKLAPRSQDTIRQWYFTEDGRELVGIGQSLINLENGYRYQNLIATNGTGLLDIPREKFLLFSADTTKTNPQGNSILKSCYLAYKRLELLQDQECLGVAKDLSGIPLIQIPPQYMVPDADPDKRAVYDMCKGIVNGISRGTQEGIVFPQMYDDNGNPIFTVKLLEHKGNTTYNLDSIIKRYQNDILVAMSANVINSDGTASFSLSTTETNLLTLALSHRLNEIAEVINTDLIAQLFSLNGWVDEELPKAVPRDVEETSLEEFSKYIQRVVSVGAMEVDRPVLNKIRQVGGIDPKPSDEPPNKDELPNSTTRSGDSFAVGKSGDGTSDIGGNSSKQDKSTRNKDNKG